MSRIIYEPHCEKCGALINRKVQFKRSEIELSKIPHYLPTPKLYEFDPWRCEVCGAVFDSAEVPLPQEVEYFQTESENKE